MPLRDHEGKEYLDDDIMKSAYGDEYIIVYKPKDLPYFVTESHNLPVRTTEIIKELAQRMGSPECNGKNDGTCPKHPEARL